MEATKETRNRTPEENLAIAKIQVMMEDSFGILSNTDSSPAIQSRARNWFDTADFPCGVIWQVQLEII